MRLKTAVLNNDGSGTFSVATDELPGLLYGSAQWGDFDEDGDLDILVNGGIVSPAIMTGIARIYRNDGGSFSSDPIELPGAVHGAARWADFDHDGDLDVLFFPY